MSTIQIDLNGHPRTLPAGTTVGELLAELGVRAEAAAVEVGQRLVPRAERATRVLRDGDQVEVVTLVGGG